MNNMNNLLFEVSDSHFSVNYLSNNQLINSWNLDLSTKSELLKKDFISDFVIKEGITLLTYTNALVVWSSKNVVLVPSSLFDHSDFDTLFELNFGKDFSKKDTDYNRNHLLGTVNLFTIPLWLKSLFVMKFPGSKIIHETSATLNYLASKNTATKFHGVLSLTDSYFDFVVFEYDKPIIFLQNSFNEVEDVIYHVTFSMQKSELLVKKGMIEIYPFSQTANSISEGVVNKLEHLQITPLVQWNLRSDLGINSIDLCV